MHNELTPKDIQMMKEELDYRRITLRPKLLEAVKEAPWLRRSKREL